MRTTRDGDGSTDGASRDERVAIVDLGSNSWRLVVFHYGRVGADRWWKRTDELYETVRIGQGLAASGRLQEAPMARGLETLRVFGRFAQAVGVAPQDVHCVATSAIRDAANGPDFLARAQDASGLSIESLPARDEAWYGYVAAVNTTTISDGGVLDLGGGSLQLVEVRDRQATACDSFPLGAVRLTEDLLLAEPGRTPKRKSLTRVRDRVREAIADARAIQTARAGGSTSARLVGLGGAARNLAAAAAHADGQLDLGVQGYRLTAERLSGLVSTLASLTPEERGSVPGIKPGRGDIVLAAALVLETVLLEGGFAAIEVTEAGLREGVFLARTLLDPDEPLIDDVRGAAVRNLATQYESDLRHTEHVAHLSLQMFDSLSASGVFDPAAHERELLWAAAMLHDVGMTIAYDDHHKHSRYLIESAELPGFDPRERGLIAQITRYHRKGVPRMGALSGLARAGDEALLSRAATILRLAEHLERGRDQSVSAARLRSGGEGVALHLDADGDLTLPRWAIERYGDDEAFSRVFGRELVLG